VAPLHLLTENLPIPTSPQRTKVHKDRLVTRVGAALRHMRRCWTDWWPEGHCHHSNDKPTMSGTTHWVGVGLGVNTLRPVHMQMVVHLPDQLQNEENRTELLQTLFAHSIQSVLILSRSKLYLRKHSTYFDIASHPHPTVWALAFAPQTSGDLTIRQVQSTPPSNFGCVDWVAQSVTGMLSGWHHIFVLWS